MKTGAKTKQIVVKFDVPSYGKISEYAKKEHRGLGEFARHAVLVYIEQYDKEKDRDKIQNLR